MPSFLLDITTTLGARIFATIGPFVVGIITARVLGPEDRGRYFLVMALAQIGTQIANLGLPSSNTYLLAGTKDLVGPLLANSLIVSFTVGPAVTAIIALVFGWPQVLGLDGFIAGTLGPVALAAVLICPLLLSLTYVYNLALAIGRTRLFNELTIGYSVLSVAAASVAAGVGGGVSLFLACTAFSVVIPTIFGAYRVCGGHSIALRFDSELFRRGVRFAVKVYLATMFGFIMTRVGAFALQHQTGIEEVGQFSVAMQLADGLTMLPATVGLLLFPKLLQIEKSQRWATMWRIFWGLAAMMLVILGLVAALAPWIVPLLFGQSFARAAILTQTLMPSVFVVSLLSVLSQYLAAEGFPRTQVLAWLIGLILQTCLSYGLAGRWGGIGVSLATAFSNTVVFGVILFAVFSERRNAAT